MKAELALILPCYNEAKSLRDLFARVISCAERRNLSPEQFQLLLVENGSKDNSREVIRELKKEAKGEYLQIVEIDNNQGYGHGIYTGLKAANAIHLAWSHADGQCDPENVFIAWEEAKKDNALLIKGRRVRRIFKEWIVSRGFEIIASCILWQSLHEINAQPKVFHESLLSELNDPPFDLAFDVYVLSRALSKNREIKEIEVEFPPREHGESSWANSLQSKLRNILKMIMYIVKFKFSKRSH